MHNSILNFQSQDDLINVLRPLKEIGLEKLEITSSLSANIEDEFINTIPEFVENNAYTEAQTLKGDVPKPIFPIDKYSVYE
jgi:hypothetical protein